MPGLSDVHLIWNVSLEKKVGRIGTMISLWAKQKYTLYIYTFEIVFIYLWLCWVMVAVRRLSLVLVRGRCSRCGTRTPRCGFSCCRA